MFRKTLLGILLIVSQSSYAAVFENCSQGVDFSNGNTYANISGTVVCHLRDNPTVKTREVGLYEGKKQGKTVLYDASLSTIRDQDKTGKLYRIEHYQLGKLEGEVRHFDPRTGKLEEFMRYRNDKKIYLKSMKTNQETFYGFGLSGHDKHQSGSVTKNAEGNIVSLSCTQFKTDDAQLNRYCGFSQNPGPEVQLSSAFGQTKMRYCQGVPCGNSSSTRANGEKSSETFINDQQQKVSREYNDAGNVVYETTSNKGRGARNEIREFFDDGKPKSVAIMENRKINELTFFYQNGKKKYHGKVDGDLVNAVHYYDNGNKREEYQFKTYPRVFFNRIISRGKPINTSKEYYESGQLYREITWKDHRKSRMLVFDEDGSLERDERYYPDGSRMNP